MCYVATSSSGDRFYNIDAHVGPGKPNHPTDVKAVQALMFLVWKTNAKFRASTRTSMPWPTGSCDPPTVAQILAYQKLLSVSTGLHFGITVDGFVSPITSSTGMYTPSMKWTLMALNDEAETAFTVLGLTGRDHVDFIGAAFSI